MSFDRGEVSARSSTGRPFLARWSPPQSSASARDQPLEPRIPPERAHVRIEPKPRRVDLRRRIPNELLENVERPFELAHLDEDARHLPAIVRSRLRVQRGLSQRE